MGKPIQGFLEVHEHKVGSSGHTGFRATRTSLRRYRMRKGVVYLHAFLGAARVWGSVVVCCAPQFGALGSFRSVARTIHDHGIAGHTRRHYSCFQPFDANWWCEG